MMNLNIGKTIKRLRREHDVTQEKLADYLGITYQAVSKWESGTACPDIALIVPLANFFGVSIDTLFDHQSDESELKISEYMKQIEECWQSGDVNRKYEIAKQAVEEFPKNHKLLRELAYAEQFYFTDDDKLKYQLEEDAIKHCELILEDCNIDYCIESAKQILCILLPTHNRREEAIALAKDDDGLLRWCLEGGDELRKLNQRAIERHMENLASALAFDAPARPNQERIIAINMANQIYQMVIGDGNYLFYHCRLFFNYMILARLYCYENDLPEAIHCLQKSLYHARENDKLKEQTSAEFHYTYFLNDMLTYTNDHISRIGTTTSVDELKEFVQIQEVFKKLYDMEEFKTLFD